MIVSLFCVDIVSLMSFQSATSVALSFFVYEKAMKQLQGA